MGIQVLSSARPQTRTIERDFIVQVENADEAEFDAIADEDSRHESPDDALTMHSPASAEHEELFGLLLLLLKGYLEHRDPGLVPGPHALNHPKPGGRLASDLMFVSHARAHLVIELLSPSTRAFDLGDERRACQEARMPELWFVDPARRSLVIDTRSGRSYGSQARGAGVVSSKAVKGCWLDAGWLWRRPLPQAVDCLREVLEG